METLTQALGIFNMLVGGVVVIGAILVLVIFMIDANRQRQKSRDVEFARQAIRNERRALGERLAGESFMFRDHLATSIAIYKIGDALRTTLDYDAGMIREDWRRETMESSDLVDEAEAESRVMASFGRVYAAIREGHAAEKEKG